MRLKKDHEISKVFAKGKSVHGELCGIKFSKNGLPDSRFAIVVGVKVAKTAVARNRLKRQIRAILAKKEAKLLTGFDVIVMTKKPAVGETSKLIEQELNRLFDKAKLAKHA